MRYIEFAVFCVHRLQYYVKCYLEERDTQNIIQRVYCECMGVYGESSGVILRAFGRPLVEATEKPREVNWFRQNLAMAMQQGNAFSILSAGRERF